MAKRVERATRRWAIVVLTGAMASALVPVAPARASSLFGLSYFGIDTRLYDARVEGRGGVGLAFRDSLNASVLTPAQLVDLGQVTVGVTSQWGSRRSEDAFGKIRRNKLTTPTVRLGLPLGSRMGLGLGFSALRATQWQVDRPYAGDPQTQEKIEREGTQFVIPFELGFRVNPHLALGTGLLLERGTIRMRYDLTLPDNQVNPSEVREDIYRSKSFKAAASVYDLGPLSVAGYYVPSHDADVDVRRRGIALSARQDGTRTDSMPPRWGSGVRVDLPGQWLVGGDVQVQQWSRYEGRGFTDVSGQPASLRDEIVYRVGVERPGLRTLSGWRSPLRAGAYWRTWHYELEGNLVQEWGVTLGTGIPFRSGTARADVAVGYSRIGSLGMNGAQEDVFRLVFSIAGGERYY